MSSSPPVDRTVARGCPVSQRFDVFGPAFQEDPGGSLRGARAQQPVFHSPILDCYVVTRWADIRAVFKDRASFSTERNGEPLTPLSPAATAKLAEHGCVATRVLGTDDSPLHTRRRMTLRAPFLPQNRPTWEPLIRRVINDYIDRFVARGRADLVAELFAEAPAVVALEFMGVPTEDVGQATRFAEGTIAFLFGRPTEAEQVATCDLMGRHQRFARELIARLRQDPSGPGLLPHAIRAAQAEPELFGDEWLVGLATTTLAAAHETTSGAEANAVALLLRDRASWEAICADPGLIAGAVEECLRVGPSLTTQRRVCVQNATLGGVPIPAGAKVLLVLASGNCDDGAFAEPETFDIRRAGANRHLTFGFGDHMCLGAPFARVQMRVMLEELTRRLPHLRLVDDAPLRYPVNAAGRGPLSLPAEWDPAANPLAADRP